MDTSSPDSGGQCGPARRQSAVLFGEELRARRAAAGLTQAEVARRARISEDFVSKLERGRRQPGLETLLRVGSALGVSAAEMVRVVEEAWEIEP